MRALPTLLVNQASAAELAEHFDRCDTRFIPRLSERVDITDYAQKIATNAMRFEAWSGDVLVGLVAVYCNDKVTLSAYITSVSVLQEWAGEGVAVRLLDRCIAHAKAVGLRQIGLQVGLDNVRARSLYAKIGFIARNTGEQFVEMTLGLEQENDMTDKRDYNAERQDTADHQYFYGFDMDVMHPFMIRAFEPFFTSASVLELGSHRGSFTRRLLPYFQDVTCVEASDDALAEARHALGDAVTFVNSRFESVVLPKRYDNIILTHVLEHLDDPVLVLKRINYEWLADGGRLFLVCPNANAPSRQIAVKMGLITHNAAVTPAEAAHGHRCTYSLDTLERDAVAAGLKVVQRSGIFFKAFANFQWDRLLKTDIVSKEYLDGCYQLGQQYPDLCSSIFLLCERSSNTALATTT